MPPRKQVKPKDLLFTANDYYGNPVTCTVDNWYEHIVARAVGLPHPELAGREIEVQRTIEDPDRIVPSKSKQGNAFVFEGFTQSETIRAVVGYSKPSQFLTGGATGFLITAYTDTRGSRSRGGMPIYEKSATSTQPKRPKKGGSA